jgi:glyoxylate/hydroxypyruvate/2-ketogluconate reductase
MPTKPLVQVTRAIFEEHLALLRAHCEVRANQDDVSFAPDVLRQRLADCDGALVTGSDRIDSALIDQAQKLRIVSSISVGINHIDIPACSARQVLVTNTPDVLTETTADMGWTLMMAAARRVCESERWLREGHWKRWTFDQFLAPDIHHSCLGIVGMGRIGQAVARRAAGFSMQVLYHNRSRLAPEIEHACNAQFASLDELLTRADHVMLVVPYSPASHHMIAARELALMKPTATLTNIARGGLIDEAALATALQSGTIAAAGLDVFEGEPRVLSQLLACHNVVLTPHIGSASRPTRDAMARLAIANLLDGLAGVKPTSLVNPETWTR